ncbi:MAG: anion permease [Dysgonomonas sp.]|jgi:PiT family inorganic phosphate transporter|uniref:inorganic phosphate transporter n=1 Tax=unclassified Dysgonomonas TaxID=2630389 RepID=UPI0025C1E549|nr:MULTISPECIES: inorganic phosphate transporter [unclassified Dysgonomonas]MDR1717143.1 inorganic phosphate transporter [Prevotella sp.]MDR2004523.1 inorganic phosphate transporter [Prevotella sp.]HMM03774.1 inorganic phosphate transporter [Dysgonomonas sp.]
MTLLIIIIVLAIIFDFINGFHDAANSIATVVSTKVLTPTQAVIWAAFFNFVAYFIAKFIIGGFGIADTVSKTVDMSFISNPSHVIIAGLVAAITWNLITWWLGIPSSSSHTLIGGFAGAGIAASGFQAVHAGVIGVIALFIVVAPLIGMVGGNFITLLTLHLVKKVKPNKADRWFKRLQLISSALLSIGHGLNDSQKVMGIIAAALIAFSQTNVDVHPWLQMSSMADMHDWVPLVCFTAIAVGTMCGGWKIMKTMGNRITKITPIEGFCAQSAGALTLFITEVLHVPVSTTHVITGSIIGVGSIKRLSAVRWGVTKDLLVAWILTIPVSAVMAMLFYYGLGLFIA